MIVQQSRARPVKEQMKILALSGSLRERSYNKAAIEALSQVAPEGVEVRVFDGVGDLPLFNPDLEGRRIFAVERFKDAIASSDGLVIASPEYAHGISGAMKNALDWLVSGEEFVYMPIMLINTSPRAHHAQDALREVVATMSGRIVDHAGLTLPLLGSGLSSDGILRNADLGALLKSRLRVFCEAIEEQGTDKACTSSKTEVLLP